MWVGAALLSSTTTYCAGNVALSISSGHKSLEQDHWAGETRREGLVGGLRVVYAGECEVDHGVLQSSLAEAF